MSQIFRRIPRPVLSEFAVVRQREMSVPVPDFAVILPRILDVGEITTLVRSGMAVSGTPSRSGLRVVHVAANARGAALDQVLHCLNLTAWETEGVRVVAGPLNRPDDAVAYSR